MKQHSKWSLIFLIWVCLAALAAFANLRISVYFAQWIAYGVQMALFIGDQSWMIMVMRAVMKIITFGILLTAEIILGIFLMGVLGLRGKPTEKSSPPT